MGFVAFFAKKINFAYMVELIRQLLFKNNCVIIPNFGAFIGNYNPSEIRLMENKIFPPNKCIAFNRSLQNNDGLLINAVSHQFSISYHEAEMQVTAFSKQCNESLTQYKSLIFKDIGKLVSDIENNIQFQPYLSKNYLLDSFGLQEMSLHPIQRLKDAESSIKESYQRILHPEMMEDAVTPKRKSSKVAYWVTAVLTILFIGFSLTSNIYKSNHQQNESSLMPSFEKNLSKPITESVQTPSPVVVAKEEIKTEDVQPLETNVTNLSLDNTYVVIGAFFTITRAEKLKEEIERKGFVVSIIKDDSEKLFHTAIQLDNEDAAAGMQKIKSEINPQAWVYCVKCRL